MLVKTSSRSNPIKLMFPIERINHSTFIFLKRLFNNTMNWSFMHLEMPLQSVLSLPRTWSRMAMPITSDLKPRPSKWLNQEETTTKSWTNTHQDLSKEQNFSLLLRRARISMRTWKSSKKSRKKMRNISRRRSKKEKSRKLKKHNLEKQAFLSLMLYHKRYTNYEFESYKKEHF